MRDALLRRRVLSLSDFDRLAEKQLPKPLFRRGPVMLDSGIRRGTDVIKALALGAACVFVGRPFNYAAAVAGQAGVDHAIDLLRQEISRNMAMMGVTSITELDPSFLVPIAAEPR